MLGNSTRILGGAIIFALALSAQTFTTLYTFSPGGSLSLGVVIGPHGELYGTTYLGGTSHLGTVYELVPPVSPGGEWTEVVLHMFDGKKDGSTPLGVIIGPGGTLFGVTAGNGTAGGVAFRLDPPTGTGTSWTYSIIHDFGPYNMPTGGLVFGPTLGYGQSMYGTTQGSPSTVFRLTPPATAGSPWTYTTLYTFPGGSKGGSPQGLLAVGTGGSLFGVTLDGGRINDTCPTGCGTVYRLTPPAVAGGPWVEEGLYAFDPQIGDGYWPWAGVAIGARGVLFGVTTRGGTGGYGTIYSLTPPDALGAPMTEQILYDLSTRESEVPAASLVLGPKGVLYGTSEAGGTSGWGTAFELMPPASPGGKWTGTLLHTFTNREDGGMPNGLTLAPDGTLYGTTWAGPDGGGKVYALIP